MVMTPEELSDLVERKLKFKYITVDFTSAAVTLEIPHGLGKTPIRWAIAKADNPAVLYGTADDYTLSLKSSVTATLTLEVI